MAYKSSLNFFQQALGFPARQPFVHQLHRHAHLFPHALRKALRFFGHFAARAIQPQWQTHHDLLHVVTAHQFTEPPHVLISIDALHRHQRLRHPGLRVRESNSNPRAPIIHRQNGSALNSVRLVRSVAHSSSIPGRSLGYTRCSLRDACHAELSREPDVGSTVSVRARRSATRSNNQAT